MAWARRLAAAALTVGLLLLAGAVWAEPPQPEAVQPGAFEGDGAQRVDGDAQAVLVERGDYLQDADGVQYRVRFDPARRVRAMALAGWQSDLDEGDLVFSAGLGLDWRTVLEFGAGSDAIRWQLEHRVLEGGVELWSPAFGVLPEMDLTLYSGLFHRHSASGSITIPSSPPKRINFPLDLGLQTTLGRVRIGHPWGDQDELQRMRLTAVDALLCFDVWRARGLGTAFELGFGPRYELELGRAPDASIALDHLLAPFTAVRARLRWEDSAGLTWLDLRADLSPYWVVEQDWVLEFESSLRFERVLLSVNDLPLSLRVEASYRTWMEAERAQELLLRAGLSWAIPLS